VPPGGRAALPRAHRVLAARDFRTALASSCRAGDRLMSVVAAPNGLPRARLGIAVSRRVARRAVDRNRIKRQVREAFRNRPLPLDGLDLIVLARGGALEASAAEIRASLEQQWQRIGKRCARS